MNFFDTNVLVAAAVPTHVHHVRSFARLAALRIAGGACSSHTLAETYNTLTRKSSYGVPPQAALKIVEQASEDFTLLTLTPKEIIITLQAAAEHRLAGPQIFDALLIACARKGDAQRIYTHDVAHFRQIAPDLAPIIHEP